MLPRPCHSRVAPNLPTPSRFSTLGSRNHRAFAAVCLDEDRIERLVGWVESGGVWQSAEAYESCFAFVSYALLTTSECDLQVCSYD